MNESHYRAPLFVFAGIVVLSILFFFLFTRGNEGGKQQPGTTSANGGTSGELAAENEQDTTPGGVMPPDGRLTIPIDLGVDSDSKGGTAVAAAPELPPSLKANFAEAPMPVRAFVSAALAGTLRARLDASANPIPTSEKTLISALFESGAWAIAEDAPPVELGQFGDKFRWKVPLRAASSSKNPPALYLDLIRTETGRGWRLADARIPPEMVAPALAALKARGTTIEAAAIRSDPDALMTAEHFMNAVAAADYDAAMAMADINKVTGEKIAGLFIIFEEGGYRLRRRKPLSATVATADAAWIVGRIESDSGMAASDFGVELARNADTGSGWRVTGLHFSKLLAAFAASTSPGDVPYAPIVDNPSGGESLVLYFGYDEDMLHLRARRQLTIVAALLKDDPAKRLRITGHADAMGTEDYNLALSGRRAFSARDSLIELGVPSRQIITEGFGETAPLAANVREDGTDNPEGRSRNRRTEIYLDF